MAFEISLARNPTGRCGLPHRTPRRNEPPAISFSLHPMETPNMRSAQEYRGRAQEAREVAEHTEHLPTQWTLWQIARSYELSAERAQEQEELVAKLAKVIQERDRAA
jgi:hypothetical protein